MRTRIPLAVALVAGFGPAAASPARARGAARVALPPGFELRETAYAFEVPRTDGGTSLTVEPYVDASTPDAATLAPGLADEIGGLLGHKLTPRPVTLGGFHGFELTATFDEDHRHYVTWRLVLDVPAIPIQQFGFMSPDRGARAVYRRIRASIGPAGAPPPSPTPTGFVRRNIGAIDLDVPRSLPGQTIAELVGPSTCWQCTIYVGTYDHAEDTNSTDNTTWTNIRHAPVHIAGESGTVKRYDGPPGGDGEPIVGRTAIVTFAGGTTITVSVEVRQSQDAAFEPDWQRLLASITPP